MTDLWLWVGFNAVVLGVLAVDLGLVDRKAHVVSLRAAAGWTVLWVTLALAFAGVIFWLRGARAGTEFLTGYIIEYSLSVDNIFVIVLIFSYFGIKDEFQHRVLFWGIIGALVMRGAMIAAGAALIERFEWITYVFGLFLVITGLRMLRPGEAEIDPARNPVIRLVRRLVPVRDTYHGQRFFVSEPDGRGGTRRMATPLFVVLVTIEAMDLVFAVDSIPAVFAVTRDPFIVYTSNVSAVLGLRSLYFLLAGVIDRFQYLRYGLALVLAFVGAKMLAAGWIHVPTLVSLGVIVTLLGSAVVVSLAASRRSDTRAEARP